MATFKSMPYNTLSFVVDAAKTALSTTAIDVGEIPAGFVVEGVAVEQLTAASAAKTVVASAKTANVALATSAALGTSTTMTKGYYTVTASGTSFKSGDSTPKNLVTYGPKAFASADTLTIACGADTVTSGKFIVTLVGMFPFAAPVASAGTNKAPDDPYTPPEKA